MSIDRQTTWVNKKILRRLRMKALKDGVTLGVLIDQALLEFLRRK